MPSRRQFLRQTLAVSIGFSGLHGYLAHRLEAKPLPLQPADPWFELPPGFTATIISRQGETMTDGFLVPNRADGMAVFPMTENRVAIVRNHENSMGAVEDGPFGKDLQLLSRVAPERMYDRGFGKNPAMGGTTTLVYNESTRKVETQYLSLAGTNRNCAGGPTPWNSWITCEEDTTRPGATAEVFHGYNFEIPALETGLQIPRPLKAMGRFNHEAVCVDPQTGIVYQTEDRPDGLIYRFLPRVPGKLAEGGTLQALVLTEPAFDTRNWNGVRMNLGVSLPVRWVTLDQVDSPEDDLRFRGAKLGAAVFARGEGMWYGRREVFFACTNGGAKRSGQIFRYIPSPQEGKPGETSDPGKLMLFAEPNDTEILKYCDNLTVAPWGDVVFVEDSSNAFLRGITPEGKIYNIGRNIGSDSELAGVCFSPSGTLFVNIQHNGLTFAIEGPFQSLRK